MHLILSRLAKLLFKGGLVFLFELGGRGSGHHARLVGISKGPYSGERMQSLGNRFLKEFC